MKMSPTIKELAAALSKAQAEIGSAEIDSHASINQSFKYSYASLTAVRDCSKLALSKYGLAVIQAPYSVEGKRFLETLLVHSSGEWISSDIELIITKNDMQGLGSAITYARRYALSSMLGIVNDEDDDGNVASGTNQVGAKKGPVNGNRNQYLPNANVSHSRQGGPEAASRPSEAILSGSAASNGQNGHPTTEEHKAAWKSLLEAAQKANISNEKLGTICKQHFPEVKGSWELKVEEINFIRDYIDFELKP